MADAEGVKGISPVEAIAFNPAPQDMTDAELDEAVALECFGWTLHSFAQQESELRKIFNDGVDDGPAIDDDELRWCDDDMNHFYQHTGHNAWDPCTDARDAERVFEWLAERYGSVAVELYSHGFARVTDGTDDCVMLLGEGKGWKRALCLAALRVARSKA